MGMFDPEFNPEVQRRRIERARLNLSQIQAQQDRSTRLSLMSAATGERLKATAKEFYRINREGFVDVVAFIQLGFQIKDNVRKRYYYNYKCKYL